MNHLDKDLSLGAKIFRGLTPEQEKDIREKSDMDIDEKINSSIRENEEELFDGLPSEQKKDMREKNTMSYKQGEISASREEKENKKEKTGFDIRLSELKENDYRTIITGEIDGRKVRLPYHWDDKEGEIDGVKITPEQTKALLKKFSPFVHTRAEEEEERKARVEVLNDDERFKRNEAEKIEKEKKLQNKIAKEKAEQDVNSFVEKLLKE